MAEAARAQDRGSDLVRVSIPVVGFLSVVMAAVGEPGRWWELLLLVAASLLLALWAWWDAPLPAIAPAMLLLVGSSQLGNSLEPGLFLISLLGIALTGWSRLTWTTGALVLLAIATPVVLEILQPPGGISSGIWLMGVLLPAAMGWGFHRQELLGEELERARTALSEQAVLAERRQIARDVHDLVGHGLAAMMLQITGARHVLERDPADAARALASAEQIGRRTLRDLRLTVGSLRDDPTTVPAPLQGLEQIADIVTDARAGGMRVDYVAEGEHGEVDQAVGLTLFRIAQASLANAAIHAPAAHTTVTSTVTGDSATLEVLSRGPLPQPHRGERRGHYGLRGMQERAEVVGGEFSAGPVPEGWLVRCRVRL
jgi:signal transduction histidine kinase